MAVLAYRFFSIIIQRNRIIILNHNQTHFPIRLNYHHVHLGLLEFPRTFIFSKLTFLDAFCEFLNTTTFKLCRKYFSILCRKCKNFHANHNLRNLFLHFWCKTSITSECHRDRLKINNFYESSRILFFR
jgi:hypothetical protein